MARKAPGDLLNNAIVANVHLVVACLKTVPIIANLIQEGKLEVIGACYHLKTGKVELLSDPSA